jgi:hypothetical protein
MKYYEKWDIEEQRLKGYYIDDMLSYDKHVVIESTPNGVNSGYFYQKWKETVSFHF